MLGEEVVHAVPGAWLASPRPNSSTSSPTRGLAQGQAPDALVERPLVLVDGIWLSAVRQPPSANRWAPRWTPSARPWKRRSPPSPSRNGGKHTVDAAHRERTGTPYP